MSTRLATFILRGIWGRDNDKLPVTDDQDFILSWLLVSTSCSCLSWHRSYLNRWNCFVKFHPSRVQPSPPFLLPLKFFSPKVCQSCLLDSAQKYWSSSSLTWLRCVVMSLDSKVYGWTLLCLRWRERQTFWGSFCLIFQRDSGSANRKRELCTCFKL